MSPARSPGPPQRPPEPLPKRLEVAPDVVFREVGGEAVILDLSTERYYGLDATGTRIWQLVSEDGSVAGVRRRMLEEFEVGEEELEEDLRELLGKLLAEGLLRPARGQAPDG